MTGQTPRPDLKSPRGQASPVWKGWDESVTGKEESQPSVLVEPRRKDGPAHGGPALCHSPDLSPSPGFPLPLLVPPPPSLSLSSCLYPSPSPRRRVARPPSMSSR